MSLEDHDAKMIYCRMLGHEVPFSYCRQGAMDQPCRKIFDCWFQVFDVVCFIKNHFTEEQITAFLSPPPSKMTTLITLVRQTQAGTQKKDI